MLINERTYLPVRIISEALGASVEWVDKTQEIIIRSEEAEIILTVGSDVMSVNSKSLRNIKMDVAPIIINDRTLLPVRFISEYLNCSVDWDGNSQKVSIKAK